MKKIAILATAVAMALTGCGRQGQEPEAPAKTAQAPTYTDFKCTPQKFRIALNGVWQDLGTIQDEWGWANYDPAPEEKKSRLRIDLNKAVYFTDGVSKDKKEEVFRFLAHEDDSTRYSTERANGQTASLSTPRDNISQVIGIGTTTSADAPQGRLQIQSSYSCQAI